MDLSAIKKDIDFAVYNYDNPENRAAVYNALHRIQAAVDTQTKGESSNEGTKIERT